MLRQPFVQKELEDELTRTNWHDTDEVCDAALLLAVEKRFKGRGRSRVEVQRFVESMRLRFKSEQISFTLIGNLIGAALHLNEPVSGAAYREMLTMKGVALVALVDDMQLNEYEMDRLLIAAENRCIAAGKRPTLAE